MMTIDKKQGGSGAVVYQITLFEPGLEKKGRTFDAYSTIELNEATNHYFGNMHSTCRSERTKCPLCRADENLL